MSRKRGNNEGSIYQRKDGRWVAQIQIGYTPEGKPLRKTIYGKTRKEVAEKLTVAQKQLQDGTMTKTNKVTLGQWLDKWIDLYQEHITPNFKFRRTELIRLHIKPALGSNLLMKLKPSDILGFYKNLSTAGRKDGKGGLSSGSILHIHNILRPALQRAVEDNLISANIMLSVPRPKIVKTRESRALTNQEAKEYLQVLSGSRLYAAYVLELTTGLRRGEVLGLQWKDLDWENRVISIKRQVSRIQQPDGGSSLEYAPLKTKTSTRQIKLPEATIIALKEHKKQQAQEKLLAGQAYADEDLVFCTPIGGKLDTRCLYRLHKKALETAKIEHIAFHDLRHTVTTWLVEAQAPLPAVQALLGHSNPNTLLNVYAHKTETMSEATANTLGSLIKEEPISYHKKFKLSPQIIARACCS